MHGVLLFDARALSLAEYGSNRRVLNRGAQVQGGGCALRIAQEAARQTVILAKSR
jgi:hypothetical protein